MSSGKQPLVVNIFVYGAKGLKPKKSKHKFSVIFGVGKSKFRTDVVEDLFDNPVFNKEASITVDSINQELKFKITEKHEKDVLGQVIVPLQELATEKRNINERVPLRAHPKCSHPVGELLFEAWITSAPILDKPLPRASSSESVKSTSSLNSGFKKLKDKMHLPHLGRNSHSEKEKSKKDTSLFALKTRGAVSCQDLTRESPFYIPTDNVSLETATADNKTGSSMFFDRPRGYEKRMSVHLDQVNEQVCPQPEVTGISPKNGTSDGGTVLTIRGTDLGQNRDDVIGLFVCGSDLTSTVKFVSSNKLICTTLPWKPCVGNIVIETQSGGRGTSTVQFTFIETDATDSVSGIPEQLPGISKGLENRNGSIQVNSETLFFGNPALSVVAEETSPNVRSDFDSNSSTTPPHVNLEVISESNTDDFVKEGMGAERTNPPVESMHFDDIGSSETDFVPENRESIYVNNFPGISFLEQQQFMDSNFNGDRSVSPSQEIVSNVDIASDVAKSNNWMNSIDRPDDELFSTNAVKGKELEKVFSDPWNPIIAQPEDPESGFSDSLKSEEIKRSTENGKFFDDFGFKEVTSEIAPHKISTASITFALSRPPDENKLDEISAQEELVPASDLFSNISFSGPNEIDSEQAPQQDEQLESNPVEVSPSNYFMSEMSDSQTFPSSLPVIPEMKIASDDDMFVGSNTTNPFLATESNTAVGSGSEVRKNSNQQSLEDSVIITPTGNVFEISTHDGVTSSRKQDDVTLLSKQDEVTLSNKQNEVTLSNKQDEVTLSSEQDEVTLLNKQNEVTLPSKQDEDTLSNKLDEVILLSKDEVSITSSPSTIRQPPPIVEIQPMRMRNNLPESSSKKKPAPMKPPRIKQLEESRFLEYETGNEDDSRSIDILPSVYTSYNNQKKFMELENVIEVEVNDTNSDNKVINELKTELMRRENHIKELREEKKGLEEERNMLRRYIEVLISRALISCPEILCTDRT